MLPTLEEHITMLDEDVIMSEGRVLMPFKHHDLF